MIMYLNKRIIFGWLLLGGLFAGACGEDEPAPAAEPLDLSIRAALAQVLTADGTASVEECRMEWSADDAFGLWGRSSRFADNNVCFTLQEVSADGEGVFSGSVSDAPGAGPQTLRALYLYRDNRGFDPAYLSVKLPAAQIQSGGVCDVKRYGFLVATLENADVASGEVAMEFSTPCAVLKLEIDAAGTPLADKKLSSVRIESERPLIGSMIYNLERNEVEVPCNGKTVNLTLADTPSLSSKCAAWFTLCEAELAGAPLKIQLLCTDKSVVDIVCEPQIALQAARVSELPLNLAALIASGDAEVSEFRVDLSENGTSNCYVVSAADKYKFRPTCGNSNDLPAGMTRIDWLWMSAPDLITEVGYEKGMVVFRAGEARGNAVIGAFNDAGEIVWSWHIWLTEDPAADLHAGMSKSYQLLDRNLGAVSTEVDDYLSYGLYYQWGRKDPFIGPRHHGTKVKREETPGFSAATADYVVNPAYGGTFKLVKNTELPSGGEIGYAVANPMNFVCFGAEQNGSGQTWFNSDFKQYLTLWGYNEATSSSSKTIYDPCPVGYKVPHFTGTVWAGVAAANLPVMSNAGLYGVMFSGAEGSSYYPAAGFRDHTGGFLSYMGQCATFWSAMTYNNLNVRGMKIEPAGKTYVNVNIKFNAAYGQSVRCVKE